MKKLYLLSLSVLLSASLIKAVTQWEQNHVSSTTIGQVDAVGDVLAPVGNAKAWQEVYGSNSGAGLNNENASKGVNAVGKAVAPVGEKSGWQDTYGSKNGITNFNEKPAS